MHDTEIEGAGLHGALSGLVLRLEEEAQRRVQRRRLVEERWLADLAQVEGRSLDQASDAQRLEDGQSTEVVNHTRAKCNVFKSKVFDSLFPTGERNWGVSHTPVPELDRRAGELTGEIGRLTAEANAAPDEEAAAGFVSEADGLAQALAQVEAQRQDAQARASLMADEIEDNLVETDYAYQCRQVIEDATHCGTGFLKGPIPLAERLASSWRQDGGKWRLRHGMASEDRFAYIHTSFWHVFPNVEARTFRHVEDMLERHLMSRRDLQNLARIPGFDLDAIRALLDEGPQDVVPDYLQLLDQIANDEASGPRDKAWTVWEYRGPLAQDEMEEIARMLASDDDEAEPIEIDPLIALDAVVWFCQGKLLKVGVNHTADNASVYHAFQIEHSGVRLWAVGIPYILRSPARITIDAWRRMLDNAAWAGQPLVEIDDAVIQPWSGGELNLRPGEVLRRLPTAGDRRGLFVHEIPVQQQSFAAIIQMALQFMDTETNISQVAAGEPGAQTTRTAGGMAMLMNATNVVFRRVIKNFDDDITRPAIVGAYNFLMDTSEKDEIKGDYAVKARGSDVLLVREVQQQTMLLLLTQVAANPVLGRYFNLRELIKPMLQSMLISPDGILRTLTELEQLEAQEQEAQENAPPDPELLKLEVQREGAQIEAQTRHAIARMSLEGEMIKLAMQRNISLEQAAAELEKVRQMNASKERILAAEAAIEGRAAGAGGSGGYFA